MGRTKKKLLKFQEELEKRQREEEDRLMKAFHDQSVKESERMDKEIEEEWETNLKNLAKDYEDQHKEKVVSVWLEFFFSFFFAIM